MSEAKPVSKFGKNFDDEGNYTGPDSLVLTFTPPLGLLANDPNAVASITLSEPNGEQMEAFQREMLKSRNEFTAGTILIHMNAGERAFTPAHAKKLKSRDFKKAIDFLTGFIPPGPEDSAS